MNTQPADESHVSALRFRHVNELFAEHDEETVRASVVPRSRGTFEPRRRNPLRLVDELARKVGASWSISHDGSRAEMTRGVETCAVLGSRNMDDAAYILWWRASDMFGSR